MIMTTVASQAVDQYARIQKFQKVTHQTGVTVPVKHVNLACGVHTCQPRTLHDMQQMQLDAIHTETIQLSGHCQHLLPGLTRQPQYDMGANRYPTRSGTLNGICRAGMVMAAVDKLKDSVLVGLDSQLKPEAGLPCQFL